MKIGFTGTREGFTHEQRVALFHLLSDLWPIAEFHHGDCVGADEEACALFNTLRHSRDKNARLICHPPAQANLRAFVPSDFSHDPAPYLERNRRIISETDLLIAAPKQLTEPSEGRAGGTWYTVRLARSQGKPVRLVLPDGSVEDSGERVER